MYINVYDYIHLSTFIVAAHSAHISEKPNKQQVLRLKRRSWFVVQINYRIKYVYMCVVWIKNSSICAFILTILHILCLYIQVLCIYAGYGIGLEFIRQNRRCFRIPCSHVYAKWKFSHAFLCVHELCEGTQVKMYFTNIST